MKPVDDVHPIAQDLLNRRIVRLRHIQDDHFNLVTFVLRTTVEPGDDIVRSSALKRRDRLTFLHVNDQRIVAVSLTSGVLINTDGSTKLARATSPTPLKGPAKDGAFRETIAASEFSARATPQELLAHLVIQALGPLHLLAEGRTRFPGPVGARSARKTPQMQPQHDGTLQYRQSTDAARAALLDLNIEKLSPGAS